MNSILNFMAAGRAFQPQIPEHASKLLQLALCYFHSYHSLSRLASRELWRPTEAQMSPKSCFWGRPQVI